MQHTFPELPDWSFDADEISSGVYRAIGRDSFGLNVEAAGIDPDALIEKCRRAALEMMASGRKPANSTGGRFSTNGG